MKTRVTVTTRVITPDARTHARVHARVLLSYAAARYDDTLPQRLRGDATETPTQAAVANRFS